MDQAETLRKLMRENGGRHALPEIAAFTGAVPGVGKSAVATQLAGFLERSGLAVRVSARLEELERDASRIDLGLLDGMAGLRPGFNVVLVTTPGREALEESVRWAAVLRREVGVRHVNLIVNRVTDGRAGRQTFERLKGFMPRFWDVQMDYLGHVEQDEKFADAVMKREFLLDLYPGAPGGAAACLELLAKRLKHKCLGVRITGKSRGGSLEPESGNSEIPRDDPSR